jgi:hypothetical protein
MTDYRATLAQPEPEGVSDEVMPHWATGVTTSWCVGAQLRTKDGRRLGNAVIASYRLGELSPWEVVTDAGTTLRLNEAELDELFWPPSWVMNVASSPGIRARTAMAQPEPEGATDSEVLTDEAIEELTWRHTCEIGDLGVGIAVEDAPAFIRALIALCASPTIEPVPVAERLPGPGDCLGRPWEETDAGFCWWMFPISEKWCFLPGPIWKGSWQCSPPLGASHWLPHHALPVPGAEVG